ncbi:MAG: TonB-dependent receptor [Gemmatimonadaceae bacterium]
MYPFPPEVLMFATRWSRIVLALSLMSMPLPLLAQGGAIAGKVAGSSGAPLAGVRVQAMTAGGQLAGSVLSVEDGSYRVANLMAGAYSVVATRIGYAAFRVENVTVAAGATATADILMREFATELNPIVTTASRRPEKALDAPASVSVVDVRDIQERPSVTVSDHVRGVPGVDVNQGGIAQSNVVARGFNNAFSGSILMLQDYRFAGVPSLRVNVPFMMTATNEDVERIEVLLGPASALYGPNSANGVLHVITKSPFTSQGTTLTVDGGERSLFRGSARHAGLLSEKVGYKLSGEFFRAKDWEYRDPGEPDVFPAQAPQGRAGQPNGRDFDLQKFTGEARMDFRPTENSEFVSTWGYTKLGSGIEMTGANGSAQIKNWSYNSVQQRARVGRFFGQVFANFSNAGNDDSSSTSGTFLLRSGQPIVDKSRVFAAQLQHGLALGTRQDFVYGADYIFTNPRTANTINGRNEDIDNVTEFGGYVQSTTALSKQFDFIAALRLDKNDQIDGSQFSPRLALVFKPTATQNFRFTYNRAFSTPANFSYFLDLIQARDLGGISAATGGAIRYDLRALGNPPKTGWEFNRTCGTVNAGLCMKSAFAGSNAWVSSSAAGMIPNLLTGLRSGLIAQLTPSLGAGAATFLIDYLRAQRPTDAQVGTRIAYISNASNPALDINPANLNDIGPLKASYNKTYELGYKGIIANRMRLAIDGWYQQRGDVGNPAGLATPNVFANGPQLGAYLGPRIVAGLMQAGFSQAQAQAAAAQIAPLLATTGASLPLGIVQFNSDQFANARDVYATYISTSNQEFTVRGVDLAVDLVATDHLTIAGTYSWVSDQLFSNVRSSNSAALMLNAPDNKASLAFKFRDEPKGLGFELRGRYTNTYPVNSGVYASGNNLAGQPIRFLRPGTNTTYVYEPVDVAAMIDLGFNKRLPFGGAREVMWSLNGTNIFNNKRRTFPGAPEIGRMVVTRLQYQF